MNQLMPFGVFFESNSFQLLMVIILVNFIHPPDSSLLIRHKCILSFLLDGMAEFSFIST